MTSQQPPNPGFLPYTGHGYAPKGSAPYPQQAMGPMAYPLQPPAAGAFPPHAAGAVPAHAFVQPGYTNQGMGAPFMPPPVHPQMFPNIPPQSPHDMNDLEDPKDLTSDWKGFTNKAIRAVFIRKVYAILMLQLTVSLAVICLFVFEKHVHKFVKTHLWMYLLAYFLFLGVYIALICCGNVRRTYPTNVILLAIFTLAKSYMLGVISSFHDTNAVLMAVGVCAGVCLAVSLFSFHSKFDFTTWGGALFVLCWVLFIFGIIAIFTRDADGANQLMNQMLKPRFQGPVMAPMCHTISFFALMTTIYAGLGTLLFVAFLAYDTQMIMGGKKHELSAEEHIFAAICLYLDVVYIFMFILMAFGKK